MGKIPELTRQYAAPALLSVAAILALADRPSLNEHPDYPPAVQIAHQLNSTGRQVTIAMCGLGESARVCIEMKDGLRREGFTIEREDENQAVLRNTDPFQADDCLVIQSKPEPYSGETLVSVRNKPCSAIFQ